tara:strand:- start:1498 stop:1758 length:261 start_codon:yes stop_codon:yes gene_type:complete
LDKKMKNKKMTKKQQNCTHHYMLPPQTGRDSLGVCKHCNHEKLHFNSQGFGHLKKKRVVGKGREPQDTIGIRLSGKDKSPYFMRDF